MNHATATLVDKLADARYKVLVACRPLQPARVAFNLALQALKDFGTISAEEFEALRFKE